MWNALSNALGSLTGSVETVYITTPDGEKHTVALTYVKDSSDTPPISVYKPNDDVERLDCTVSPHNKGFSWFSLFSYLSLCLKQVKKKSDDD